MNTDNITLYEKDILAARKLCASITDRDKRNRAVANVIGVKLAASYFDTSIYSVDTESGLHNVAPILESFEISDMYVNNSYIDVRVYFSDEEICVPKVHFDIGALPLVYMFIKLSPDLSTATVQGFVYPERVDKTKLADDVYFLSPNDIESFYNIESKLKPQMNFPEIDETRLLSLLEGNLSGDEVISVLRDLVKSRASRLKLIKYIKAQSAFNLISVQDRINAAPVENLSDTENNGEESSDLSKYNEQDISDEDLDSLFETDEVEDSDAEYSTSVTPSGADVIESLNEEEKLSEEDNSEQLESLFTGTQEGVPTGKTKKRSGGFLLFLVLGLLVAGGIYMYYTNSGNKLADLNLLNQQKENVSDSADNQPIENNVVEAKTEDAMPVETVENGPVQTGDESISTTSVPAIERSLDASVLVSNLKIDWEVPEGYASNTAAKRYFMKLGKIIQLNLKTELLLLQKPPLSNKITVELRYNSSAGRFEAIGIKDSSGEKSVDDLILNTVDGVLKMSASTNIESISKIQGAPLLIIHL